jgi:hypothetical protein
MMTSITFALILGLLPAQAQEAKPIPADSVEVFSRGCLKGRVFTATAPAEDEGATRGPDVMGRHFRTAGSHEIMDQVKAHNGHLVEIVGIVRKSALADEGIGVKVGGRARVVIGAPGTDPNRSANMAPAGVPTMDITALRLVSERCPVR